MTRLSGLAAATTVTADDLLHVVDDPAGANIDKKITAANLKAYILNPITLPVIDPSGAGYAIQQTTGLFESGVYSDTTFNLGYNNSSTPGVKVVPTEPLLFLQLESKYRQNSSSPYGSEFHLNFGKPGDGSAPPLIRPFQVFMEHATGLISTGFVGDNFSITTSANAALLEYTSGSWYARKGFLVSVASATSLLTVGEAQDNAMIVLNANSSFVNTIAFQRSGVAKWLIYDAGTNDLYIRNQQNSRMQISLIAGATDAAAYTDFGSNIRAFGVQGQFGPATNQAVVGSLGTTDAWLDSQGSNANINLNLRAKGSGIITSLSNHSFSGNLTMADAKNIILNATTGTKIGTAASQKLAFFNSTPIVQPTVTGSRGANAALASLLTQLATLGLIVDSTS